MKTLCKLLVMATLGVALAGGPVAAQPAAPAPAKVDPAAPAASVEDPNGKPVPAPTAAAPTAAAPTAAAPDTAVAPTAAAPDTAVAPTAAAPDTAAAPTAAAPTAATPTAAAATDQPAAGAAAPPAADAPPPAKKAGEEMPKWVKDIDARPWDTGGNFWMPTAASTAARADYMFYAVLALSAFFFFAITACTVYFVIKYRHRPGHKAQPSSAHSDTMEITWTVIPTIICVFLFIGGWNGYMDLTTRPAEPEVIKVTAKKWVWDFEYPNGLHTTDLHLPKDRPVELQMTSVDVLHSFFVPAFRVKQDVVPRRYSYVYITATQLGTYRLYCTEYCGRDHSQMKVKAHVHDSAVYDRYLSEVKRVKEDMDPVELGKIVFNDKGCATCHSVDGSPKVGPSWKGIWGDEVQMASGETITVNADYIKTSIFEPQKLARPGFPANMPTYLGALNEAEINGVAAYIESLK